jgi:hypothetical protein
MAKSDVDELLDMIFRQAQMQFGNAIKSRWVHARDECPGCGRKVDDLKWKGQRAISINAYMYREQGVLIAYLLCGKCGKKVNEETEKNPIGTTPLHTKIEQTLRDAYLKKSGH